MLNIIVIQQLGTSHNDACNSYAAICPETLEVSKTSAYASRLIWLNDGGSRRENGGPLGKAAQPQATRSASQAGRRGGFAAAPWLVVTVTPLCPSGVPRMVTLVGG